MTRHIKPPQRVPTDTASTQRHLRVMISKNAVPSLPAEELLRPQAIYKILNVRKDKQDEYVPTPQKPTTTRLHTNHQLTINYEYHSTLGKPILRIFEGHLITLILHSVITSGLHERKTSRQRGKIKWKKKREKVMTGALLDGSAKKRKDKKQVQYWSKKHYLQTMPTKPKKSKVSNTDTKTPQRHPNDPSHLHLKEHANAARRSTQWKVKMAAAVTRDMTRDIEHA